MHVKIDKTPPVVLITSPSRGELVDAGPVVVRGSATDGLSGPLGVSCHGTAATLDDTGFTCQVVVPVGTTTIEVRATDVASNVRTVTVDVTTVDDVGTTPPTRLRVSPSTATVVVGASRAFSVRDDFGRIPPGVTWSVDTEEVVSLAPAAGGVTVVAQAAGVVHVTASWQGLTAGAEVTVLATVGTMPEVVTLWSAPTVGGAVQRIVQGATTIDGTHRLYTYESTGEDDSHDVIRAFEADGREAWSAAVGGRVLQLSGDPSGGVVALVDDRQAYTTRLLVFGPNGSGGNGPEGVGPFAIHPNGPLYYVDQSNTLVGLDIGLGSGPGTTVAGTPGYPTVLLDGSVVVPSVIDSDHLQLTFVRPSGAVETQSVNLPNGALWYPYRAVPNGQGGLLVQLRRWLWREMSSEVWDVDALVIGVDAAGTVTGSEPLGADWGEIVVGGGGTVLATSKVDYWTEPFYGGLRKQHVGMVTPLTPEGNRAAFPTFFGPSGPCGWVWDAIGERWYYNGDCDQAVISVTSIAARSSDTLLTLNDGRVFGPEPLSQLQLSYLVPAADGTYLGAGVAGAPEGLVNLAVTSEEPASPFGPMWPAGGGGLDLANAANPLGGLKLLGANEAARDAEIQVFRDALEEHPIREGPRSDAAGALLLFDNNGFLGIRGDLNAFKDMGTVAHCIANFVKPVPPRKTNRIIEFGLVGPTVDLESWGGARTILPGVRARRIRSGAGGDNPQVLIRVDQVHLGNDRLCCTVPGANGFEGQGPNLSPFKIQPIFYTDSSGRVHVPIAA